MLDALQRINIPDALVVLVLILESGCRADAANAWSKGADALQSCRAYAVNRLRHSPCILLARAYNVAFPREQVVRAA